MSEFNLLDAWPILTVAGSVFGSGVAVKYTASANKEKLKDISKILDEHVKIDAKVQLELVDRLARIETKLDDLRGR